MDNDEDNDSSVERKAEDIIKILVATDIHLGFEEKDPIRGQDTFDTFEEILESAAAEEVDFILLGGDLFHHAQPSPYCIYKCMELLRKYCLGDRPVEIEFLSDPSHNFQNLTHPTVNYEDPNLNVSIPVFSIHGNHDDPTGQRQISAMDLLSTTGLVNYFGRWTNYDNVEIEPILLRKGITKLALFGLSHIKDERLGRLFLDKKVKMLAPEKQAEWVNLLVWHQNRASRGVKNFIPDDILPNFLDLVIWGHEHDCKIEPERRTNDVYVSQPGSTVATSLVAGEAIPKKIGILKIHGNLFGMTSIELKTVRPFVWDELILQNLNEIDNEDGLTHSELTMELVTKKVNEMIKKAKQLGRNRTVSEKPLIRLNVKYKDERQVFNTIRFGQQYVGKVANPEDMIKCQSNKQSVIRRGAKQEDDDDFLTGTKFLADRVEDIVLNYFKENNALKCLPVYALNEAVKKFIDDNDNEAITLVSDHLIKETINKLEDKMPDVEEVKDFILNFKEIREAENANFIEKVLNNPNRKQQNAVEISDSDDDDDNNDKNALSKKTSLSKTSPASTSRGATARGGPGSRGGRRGRGRAK